MAKSKHSIALFEVIQHSKKVHKPAAELLCTPKWWYKSKAAVPKVVAPPPVVESSAPAPQVPGVDLKVDPDRQRIKFEVTYTSAAISAFAVIVVLALAYVVGVHMSTGPTRAIAGPSTEMIRSGPVHPEVLDVKGVAAMSPAARPAVIETQVQPPAAAPIAEVASTQPAAGFARIIGRNYVVVQSYPDEKTASDITALLNRNKIPCTYQQGLANYANEKWWCVIGMTGFDHMSNNSEYTRYLKALDQLSESLGKDSKFKKFQPQTVKWKG